MSKPNGNGRLEERIAEKLGEWQSSLTIKELIYILEGDLEPSGGKTTHVMSRARLLVDEGFSEARLADLVNFTQLEIVLKLSTIKRYKTGKWLECANQLRNKGLPFWYALDMHRYRCIGDRHTKDLVFADRHLKVDAEYYNDKIKQGLRITLPDFARAQDLAQDFLRTVSKDAQFNRDLFMRLVELNWCYLVHPRKGDDTRVLGRSARNFMNLLTTGETENALAYVYFSIFAYLQLSTTPK